MFVADDLGGWLIGLLADAGRRKLTAFVLGTDQEQALRKAATAAMNDAAQELCPDDEQQAGQLAMVVSQVFTEPVSIEQQTALEAIEAGIARQIAVLADASLTGTGQSSLDLLGIPGQALTAVLTRHLIQRIVISGTYGGPLAPLANQLNHDLTHLQGQRLHGMLARLVAELGQALTTIATRPVAAAPSALMQLPATNEGFTGRAHELAVLSRLLNPAVRPGTVVVTAGLAGVGKTSLAVHAAQDALARGWYPGGVLFINLHGYDEVPVDAAQALGSLLRALGTPAEHIPSGTEDRAALYRSVLAETEKPVLVIADNASSEAQVRPLRPGTGPHKLLVTSRHTLAGMGARLFDVSVLGQSASVRLLNTALRNARPDDNRISGDPDAARRLAGSCGGLPLALQITAALLIADPMLSTAELAGELDDERQRLERLSYDDGSGTATASVAAAFELSYHRLNATAARVFRLLPLDPGPDVSTAVAAALTGLAHGEARAVLGTLIQAHLVEAAPGAPGRWRMHDLVRLYAQRQSDGPAQADGREQARDRLLDHYLRWTHAADAHLRAVPGAPVPDQFGSRDDAVAWLDAQRASLIAAVQMAADTGREQAAMRLPGLMAEYLDWRHLFDDWLSVSVISVAMARRAGHRRYEGRALNNLGAALRGARLTEEAVTACQDAAAIHRQAGDRRREANALNNLGLALLQAGRTGDAIAACEQAARIYRQAGDQREGSALSNLGAALRHAGRPGEAITACRAAAEIHRQAGDRRREGGALNNLGAALLQAHRDDQAIAVCQDAAAIHRQAGDRHGEAGALNNLGLALLQAGRTGDAIAACEQAARIYRQAGDRHSEQEALDNLARTRNVLQDYPAVEGRPAPPKLHDYPEHATQEPAGLQDYPEPEPQAAPPWM
jgi:tetratricopeptide (TPR) repeat protein